MQQPSLGLAPLDYLIGVYNRAMPLVRQDIDRFKDFLRRLMAD